MRLVAFAGSSIVPLAVGVWLGMAAPAGAQQTSISQEFDDIRNSIGLGTTKAPNDYTERAPLVVPPTNTLPPPGSGGPDALGVTDTDTTSRRQAMSDSRRPVPPSDPGAAAAGLSSRTYLTDPPSGLRDPRIVAADITTDRSSSTGVAKAPHHHRTHKTSVQPASQ